MGDLRPKLVGGLQGTCDECERRWEPTDGLPSAHYDNFVLQAKAQAPVDIARGGLSLRAAAHEVRMAVIERRTGRRPPSHTVERDGRMAREIGCRSTRTWSPGRYLPTERPRLITVDSFDVRVTAFDAKGQPTEEGQAPLLGLRCGRLRARQPPRTARACGGVRRGERAGFREFFRQ